MIERIERVLTNIERSLLCGDTWATQTMSFTDRLRFYRDTGEWPGLYSKEVIEMFMQNSIDQERADGKSYCAQRKLDRAKEANLDIK